MPTAADRNRTTLVGDTLMTEFLTERLLKGQSMKHNMPIHTYLFEQLLTKASSREIPPKGLVVRTQGRVTVTTNSKELC